MVPPFSEKTENGFSNFRSVPNTGVIYVMERAAQQGFVYGAEDWCNLGQGAPETNILPGAPARLEKITVDSVRAEYSPVAGMRPLREAVASLYNERYRKGRKSQYSWKNVAISSGGRAGLTRVAAALGRINLGHFLPDYTAYEELLDLFRVFVPIPIVNQELRLPRPDELAFEIKSRGLGGLLLSNPVNPTGNMVYGDDLKGWIKVCRELSCTLILDEFYSHYLYGQARKVEGLSASACRYVGDVEQDQVLVVDGLTKNWRYPGLRLSWTIGPEHVIEKIASAGSFLDGGASHPIQKAALELINPTVADAEARAIQSAFDRKRELVESTLERWRWPVFEESLGGFYAFPCLSGLPESLRDGRKFFEACLAEKVICVPGEFFDVNPGQRRQQESRLKEYVRLSFGPSYEEVAEGLARIEKIVAAHS